MASRNLLLRSIENGIYDKHHLTRVRYEVGADLMTTDMGNSYLSMRTTLLNSITKTPVITEQLPGTTPTFYMFGDGETTYDPSCLFRSAKLINKQSGQVIEELNYNNVRTQTFKEYTMDFEDLASSTTQNGMGIPDAKLDNLQSTYTLWTNENPVQLHVPLKSIFPSLNTPAYQLGAMGGLIVDLEFDTTKNFVMAYSDPLLVVPPPALLASGHLGFDTATEEDFSWLVKDQVNTEFGAVEKPLSVPIEEFWSYPPAQYWATAEPFSWDGTSNQSAGIETLRLGVGRRDYTDNDLAELGLSSYGTVMNLELKNNGNNVVSAWSGKFHFKDMSGNDGEVALIENLTPANKNVDNVEKIVVTDIKNIVPSPPSKLVEGAKAQEISFQRTAEADWILLKDHKKITLTTAEKEKMVEVGMLTKVKVNNADEYSKVDGVDFKVYIQHRSTSATLSGGADSVFIIGDKIDGNNVISSTRRIQLPRMAVTRNSIESLTANSAHLILTTGLDIAGTTETLNALGYSTIKQKATTPFYEVAAPTSFEISFQEVKRDANALFDLTSTAHYPSIDLAEMTLVQYPPTKNAMPKFFRTIAVEAFNINSNFQQVVQNFMLEPNVYNCYVCIPSSSSSLICKDGNILNFRATIDEIDVVNKDVKMGVYPDSLYWDKLIDTFSNSTMSLKSINGMVNGSTQRPVRVLPVRIYSAMLNNKVNFSNTMKRLQIRMEAPLGASVESGTAFLFKEKFKAY